MENTLFDWEGYPIIDFVSLPPKLVDIQDKDENGILQNASVRYEKEFFTPEDSIVLLKELRSYDEDGLNDGGTMYGVNWISGRKTIQISDPGVPVYKYTGSSAKHTEPIDKYPAIEKIRRILYDKTGIWFNFCLYNSYPLDSKLGWHSDNEKNMVSQSPIGSLSFGFKRRFRVRNTATHDILFDEFLESGSLLIMEDGCQSITEHCIWALTEKQMEDIKAEYSEEETFRINLTFRRMVPMS
jgi:hypothetical protein